MSVNISRSQPRASFNGSVGPSLANEEESEPLTCEENITKKLVMNGERRVRNENTFIRNNET